MERRDLELIVWEGLCVVGQFRQLEDSWGEVQLNMAKEAVRDVAWANERILKLD